jgi:hypothetical protein
MPAPPAPAPAPAPGGESENWATRSAGDDVVWRHNFATSSEITAHLVSYAAGTTTSGPALSPTRVVDAVTGSAMRYITLGSRLKNAYTSGGATMVLEDATHWPDPAVSGTYNIVAADNDAAMPETHNLFTVTAKSGNTISVTWVSVVGQPFTTQRSFDAGSIVGHQNVDKWSRVFSALKADSNGIGVDDINNAGNTLRSKFDQPNFPYTTSMFGYGFYGHRYYWDTATNPSAEFETWRPADYPSGSDTATREDFWDGDEFYIQFRVRIDPRFQKTANLVAYDADNRWSRKIFMLQAEATVPQQIVTNYRPGGQRYWIPSTKDFPFYLNTSSPNSGLSTRSISEDGIGGGSLQPGSAWEATAEFTTNQAAGTWWEWPIGSLVTFQLRVKPGYHWNAKVPLAASFTAPGTMTFYNVLQEWPSSGTISAQYTEAGVGTFNAVFTYSGKSGATITGVTYVSGDVYTWPVGTTITAPSGLTDALYKNTLVETKVALDGDSDYTTVIDTAVQAIIFGSDGNNQGLWYGAVPGYSVLEPTGYLNVDLGSLPPAFPYWVDFSEFIFSKGPIPLPTAAPSINLSGSTWTPDRNSGDEFYVSQLRQLTVNTWYYVGGADSMLDTVIATPDYPSYTAGDSSAGIVGAWGGAAWDPILQRMYITGGGHTDSSAAETGVYMLDATTLKFTRVVDRQPLASALQPSGGIGDPCSALIEGDIFPGGNNFPLSTGVPGSQHTYDGIPFISPETMQGLGFTGNVSGGIFYYGKAKAVVNLDDGTYSKLHWVCDGGPAPDMSYAIAFVDGDIAYYTGTSGAGFAWFRWDMSSTEFTSWATSGYDPDDSIPSFGEDLAGYIESGAFTYNRRAFCWMRERREVVFFAGDQAAKRIRYGEAIDASAADWTAYTDTITLTGAGAADFTSTNLDDTSESLLSQTSGSYDHYENRTSDTATGAIWLQAKPAGGQLYKITGLDTNTWTVTKIAGTGALVTGGRGTYGRFVVASVGGTKFALRVTSHTGQLEIMRLS